MKKALILILSLTFIVGNTFAKYNKGEVYIPKPKKMVGNAGSNQDPTKADIYKKLDTLDTLDGKGKIKTAKQWLDDVRPQVMKFVENELYSPRLPRPRKVEFTLLERSDNALNGTATRLQYKITSCDKNGEHSFTLLIYFPQGAKNCPVFVNANYGGNHTVIEEKEVIMPKCYLRNNGKLKTFKNKAEEHQRGLGYSRHCIREIIERGYAIATFCYCEVYPDKYDERLSGFDESIYRIYDKSSFKGETQAIGAWAYGNILARECIETIPELDATKAIVIGHSRLGKAALYATALDKRFAAVISNASCILGTSMNRRNFGGTLKIAINASPFWYGSALKKYENDIEKMPIDQQHFLACIAPRPLYVGSATDDHWCDPTGEFYSLLEASKIYKLFGAKNLPTMDNLRVETPFHGDVGYHLRRGNHDITLYDWTEYMNFIDKTLLKK